MFTPPVLPENHSADASWHRFEAGDESQDWPELNAAIRAARMRYQAGGEMPDWHDLDEQIRRLRMAPGA